MIYFLMSSSLFSYSFQHELHERRVRGQPQRTGARRLGDQHQRQYVRYHQKRAENGADDGPGGRRAVRQQQPRVAVRYQLCGDGPRKR